MSHGEVWIDRADMETTIARFYAQYPANRQGRRAAERKMAKHGIEVTKRKVSQ